MFSTSTSSRVIAFKVTASGIIPRFNKLQYSQQEDMNVQNTVAKLESDGTEHNLLCGVEAVGFMQVYYMC